MVICEIAKTEGLFMQKKVSLGSEDIEHINGFV